MTKQAKLKQTDYTTGGRDISNTAIPLYQDTLTQMADYNADKGISTMQDYYNTLYSNSTDWNDKLRSYKRAMSDVTSNNYSATSGGYTSSGQRNYDDQQRYWNDQMSRLYDTGIQTSANLANQYYNNLINGATTYNNAYKLGQDYSDIEQYNDLVDQSNNNWLSNLLTSAGAAASNSNNPWVAAAGQVVGTAGNMIGTDTSSAMAQLRSKNSKKGDDREYNNYYANQNTATKFGENLGSKISEIYDKYFKGTSTSGNAGSSSTKSGYSGTLPSLGSNY